MFHPSFFLVTLILTLTACGEKGGSGPRSGKATPPAEMRFGVPQDEAQRIALAAGERLYEKDRAAWLASDAVLERYGGKMAPGVRGWLVLEDTKRVVFFGGDAGAPQPLVVVNMGVDGSPQISEEAIELSLENRSAIAARETAKSVVTTHCGSG